MEFFIDDERTLLRGMSYTSSADEQKRFFPLYINTSGKFLYYPGNVTHRDNRPDHQVIYTNSGRAHMTVDGVTLPLLPGSIVMIYCNHLHEFEADSEEGWLYSYMHITGNGVESYAAYLEDELRVLYPRDTSEIESIYETLLSGTLKNDPVSKARICTLISQVLCSMISTRFELSDPMRDINHSALTPALMYIHQNYMYEITLDDLAATMHLSKYHFAHMFREVTGLPPYQYITQFRIKQAKHMLTTSYGSISNVAASVGFPTVNRFIYHFNRLVGVTPRTFRDAINNGYTDTVIYNEYMRDKYPKHATPEGGKSTRP